MIEPIEFKASILEFDNNLWSYYLAIPKEVGNPFIEGDNRRVKCFINNLDPLRSALMPKGDVFSIYLKKEFLKQHGISPDEKVNVRLEKDYSEYGFLVPESFEILLDQDEEGRKFFKSLSMGKQRSLIYLVTKVKNIDSQLAKGLAIMHHLKEANGKLDFKRLNALIKEYNSRK